VYVTKADGSKQLFDQKKVVKTCLRLGASRRIAEEIARDIEKKMYNGITTEKILQMIFGLLSKYRPAINHLLDLRKGLSLMNSKPEFERFVQILLEEHGYKVTPNRILRGKCVEHEMDAIATKDNITYFVEAKHHSNYHTSTGLDESRIARAVLEDVTEGYEDGVTDLKIDRALIITNTRFSEHARRYGKCRNILQIGWSFPSNHGLQDLIEEKDLHPLACLKCVDTRTKMRLASTGIVLMKQLVDQDPEALAKRIGMSKKAMKNIIENVKTCAHIWRRTEELL